MTENKMPVAVRVWKNGRLYCRDYNDVKEPIYAHNSPIEKYLRAEPVKDLLKQARDAMKSGNHNHIIGAITAIDKFLEEK